MNSSRPILFVIAIALMVGGIFYLQGLQNQNLKAIQITLPTPGVHTLEIQVEQPGLRVFTFTFG